MTPASLYRSQQQQLERMAQRGDPRAIHALRGLAQPDLRSHREPQRLETRSAQLSTPRTLDQMVLIKLPIPPSVNGIYRPGEHGKRRLTDKAKQWKRDAAALVRAAHSHATPHAGPVKLEVTLTPADARRFDIDNRLKLLLDALQDGALIKDDAQILELSVSKRPPCKAMSRATLCITKIGGV